MKSWFKYVLTKQIDEAIEASFSQLTSLVNEVLEFELRKRDVMIGKLVRQCNVNAGLIRKLPDKLQEVLDTLQVRNARVVPERDNTLVIDGLAEQ